MQLNTSRSGCKILLNSPLYLTKPVPSSPHSQGSFRGELHTASGLSDDLEFLAGGIFRAAASILQPSWQVSGRNLAQHFYWRITPNGISLQLGRGHSVLNI